MNSVDVGAAKIDPLEFFNPAASSHKNNIHAFDLFRLQQWEACLKFINEASKKSPPSQNVYLRFLRGVILRSTGYISDALQEFRDIAFLEPHNILNLKNMAQTLYLLGRYRPCIALCDEIASIIAISSPTRAPAHTVQAENSSGPATATASAARKPVAPSTDVSQISADIDIVLLRAKCLQALGLNKVAFALMHSVIPIRPSPSLFLALSQIRQTQGDDEAAVSLLTRALKLFPRSRELLSGLARMYVISGNLAHVRSSSHNISLHT